MTMNNRDVKSVFVKLIAGLVLVIMLMGVAAPAAFAEEQTTEAATTEAATTEAETAAPETDAPAKTLDSDTVEDIADMLRTNDAARQLFLAACGKNSVGEG